MSKDFHDIKIGLDEDLEEKLAWLMPNYSDYRILRKSVDARRRHAPHLVYSVRVFSENESATEDTFPLEKVTGPKKEPVIVIGAGPAGLFAAIRLAERGIPVRLFERGSEATKRLLKITKFWRYGEFDPQNNVCFGEGGAGLYSDGKLITRVKSPYIPYVMQRLVQFGAPKEIQYMANPHVGSDRIRRVIPKIREYLIALGTQIHFDSQVTELVVEDKKIVGIKTINGEKFYSPQVILATGHSADDMFHHLRDIKVTLQSKSFAVGLRIEHPQQMINQLQYRTFADHPKLDAANYKLAFDNKKTKTGVYSFCMCPGGYVLSSGSSAEHLVCNGMSNYRRNSAFANSAIVVTVNFDHNQNEDPFRGLEFRNILEAKALQQVREAGGTKQIPVQTVSDFLNQKISKEALPSSCLSGVIPTRLDELLPKELVEALKLGLEKFNRSMPGFSGDQAQFHGIESRTSCPIRVLRNEDTLESVSHPGLYPAGEGAGYAGGITSAACDGIRIAESIAQYHYGFDSLDGLDGFDGFDSHAKVISNEEKL